MVRERFPLLAEAAVADAPPRGGGAVSAGDSPPSPADAAPLDKSSQAPVRAETPGETDESLLGWLHIVPQEFRDDPNVTKYKSLGEYMKGSQHAVRRINDSVLLPKGYDPAKGLANEGISQVFKRLGMPEKPEDYSITHPEEGPGIGWDDELERKFRLTAHQQHMLPWQVQPFVDLYNQHMQGLVNQVAAQRATAAQAGKVELTKMYGADTDNVLQEANALYVSMGEGAFGGPEIGAYIKEKMEELGLTNDPKWVTGMANLASKMREGTYHTPDTHFQGSQNTADQMKEYEALIDKAFTPGGLTVKEKERMDALAEVKARLQAPRR